MLMLQKKGWRRIDNRYKRKQAQTSQPEPKPKPKPKPKPQPKRPRHPQFTDWWYQGKKR